MKILTPNDLIGNGSYDGEMAMAIYMYGSLAEYFTAFMRQKEKDQSLTSQRFMTKSIASIQKVYAERTGKPVRKVEPKPEPVQSYDDDQGFPIF